MGLIDLQLRDEQWYSGRSARLLEESRIAGGSAGNVNKFSTFFKMFLCECA